ncbi:MAG: DUF2066 domain-containing protein [Gammaproteobacteria bacterium]|nr:DUF2066 domain-containing protein [Gammaproteobacteria bacterium]
MAHPLKLAIWILFAISVAAFSTAGRTEVMKDLYTASWPVDDQSSQVRNRALGNAFAQVLVRASGHEKVLNSPAIQNSIANASDYMRLYSYQKLNLAEQKIYKKPLLLKVSFEPTAVTNLLKDAGQAVWSDNRPSGVFWIAVDNNGEREIAADGQDVEAVAVRKQANHRGLPVVIPLMDLDDKSAVTISDVWGKFSEPVTRASRRYNADYVVMGSMSASANGWQGSWLVDLGNDNMRFTTSGASTEQAVSKMVDRIADRLAMKLAVVLSSQTEIDYVLIKGLSSIESYAKAQSLLNNLSMVSSVNAIEVKENEVLFEIGLQSATQYLIDALELSSNLRRTTADSFDNSTSTQRAIVYNWRD